MPSIRERLEQQTAGYGKYYYYVPIDLRDEILALLAAAEAWAQAKRERLAQTSLNQYWVESVKAHEAAEAALLALLPPPDTTEPT